MTDRFSIASVSEFSEYLDKQIEPAIKDIQDALQDSNRKHIQKLVLTNIVDRFDVMIDKLILSNCRYEYIFDFLSDKMSDFITEKDLISLLINTDSIQAAIDERLKNMLRNSILRKRHSLKVKFVFEALAMKKYTSAAPLVQVGTGKIDDNGAQHGSVKVPSSVLGYADWLYSRRNAIVHGSDSKYLDNDRNQLKKLYKFECPERYKITLGSLKNAVSFYRSIVDKITHAVS